jgi:nucleoid-associated protein YgaU
MSILRAGLKVAAVLSIAILVILFIAAILYALQKTKIGDAQDVARNATGASPSNAFEFSSAARLERTTPTPTQSVEPETPDSRSVEPETPDSASESPVEAPYSSVSESEPPDSTDNAPERASFEIDNGEISAGDNKPLVAEESTAPRVQESPATPSTASEAVSENSEPTQSASGTSGIRYYTVESGDTLYSIARRFYGAGKHWRAVYNANRTLIDDARELKLGWQLELPPLEKVGNEN